MTKDRLLKLARLATGAAVVSMGPVAACTPSGVTTAPTDGPHINSPPTPTQTTGADDLAEAGITLHPGVNAPMRPVDADDAGADASLPAHRPPHVNALPPQP